MKTYHLTLTLQCPVLFQASGTIRLGLDTALQRYNGLPVINGSLIRGNIRHALREFAETSGKKSVFKLIDDWFGKASANDDSTNTGFEPHKGKVSFDFFWTLVTPLPASSSRTRIQLNEDGVNVSGAVQVLEDAFPLGNQAPEFTGTIRADLSSSNEFKEFELWIKRALCFIPSLGSLKGIGFGRLQEFEFTAQEDKAVLHELNEVPDTTDRLVVQLSFDRPFSLGRPRTPDSNMILSDSVVPGAVIKGMIAATYGGNSEKLQRDLCFDNVHFSHFKPVQSPSVFKLPSVSHKVPRPAVIPLSIAFLGNEYYDVSQCDPACVWARGYPVFSIDWKCKQWQKVEKELTPDCSEPNKILLVRTAINNATGTAKEGELFSLECVQPEAHVWQGCIDLSNVVSSHRSAVRQALKNVLSRGLQGMGKTRAASRSMQWFAEAPNSEVCKVGSQAVISLQTEAQLFKPGVERRFSSVDSSQSVIDEYQAYWDHCAGNELQLIRCFAQQVRVGGAHHYWKYQRHGPYSPCWLTKAGSVFVVKVLTERGSQLLDRWQRSGLPCASTGGAEQPTWRETPFLPENGYGEILINWRPQIDLAFAGKGAYGEQGE